MGFGAYNTYDLRQIAIAWQNQYQLVAEHLGPVGLCQLRAKRFCMQWRKVLLLNCSVG